MCHLPSGLSRRKPRLSVLVVFFYRFADSFLNLPFSWEFFDIDTINLFVLNWNSLFPNLSVWFISEMFIFAMEIFRKVSSRCSWEIERLFIHLVLEYIWCRRRDVTIMVAIQDHKTILSLAIHFTIVLLWCKGDNRLGLAGGLDVTMRHPTESLNLSKTKRRPFFDVNVTAA